MIQILKSMEPSIRPARPGDEQVIFGFIQELAAYENLAHTVTGTPAQLHQHLFTPPVMAQAWIVEWEGEPVGYGLGFPFVSGLKHGLYLEDLYISPAFRRQGLGQTLLAFLANLTRQRGGNAMRWTVLADNTPAIQFYQQLGAMIYPQARIGRLTEAALIELTKNNSDHPDPTGVIRTYTSYSTFLTQPGLFVADRVDFGTLGASNSDLVEIELRGLARLCSQRNYGRLEWWVNLGEVDPWLGAGLGGEVLADWRFCDLNDSALTSLAARSPDHGSIR
ncbi:GNAT family N-acetyltransferase [Thermosynechococcaceae cyanobacterium BACA0444]|uniref:GNAT family N-acetyltransferase n=1 Tax=Pseudocalidococcus azoricus BACA0444 TaxID=2918990 RepID=A0AAE4FUT1_9CYAN|nr:GNAT family N-acetyltransferase [Pseudocalidococcus azoricus]MDS3862253.1 GNAT family N-acetyltransferase [Pseudocalidococcus azoricus BACA0444]